MLCFFLFFHYNKVFRQNWGGCVRFECLQICGICYPVKAIKAFQIQKRYKVWMNKYEKRAYGGLESFW